MLYKLLLALAAASGTSAHFGITYPPWRFDTLSEAGEAKYSQWTYPCAGVPYQANNVTTDWPTGGGSLKLELHHAWTYVFVNLGLGTNVTNFNVSLTPQFWNVTGKGTLCVDKLAVPVNVSDGALASLQVVTVGDSGNALYNCADIRFKNDAKTLSNCTTTPGIKVNFIKDQTGNGSTSGNSSTGGSSGGGSNGTSGSGSNQGGAGVVDANMLALFTVVALASGLAMGL